jgi:predicted nucleic acid-binding protein
VAEKLVLDTSAWLALDEAEPGASDVEAILAAAWLGEKQVFTCFVTLTELDYIRTREHDAQQAAELLAFARAQRVTWIHSDDALCATAAKLKAAHRLSFADAFVAALAVQLEATLVHKDPELSALASVVKQQVLPLKSSSAPQAETS